MSPKREPREATFIILGHLASGCHSPSLALRAQGESGAAHIFVFVSPARPTA